MQNIFATLSLCLVLFSAVFSNALAQPRPPVGGVNDPPLAVDPGGLNEDMPPAPPPPPLCPRPSGAADCGGGPCVAEFRSSASLRNNPGELERFIAAVGRPNVTALLGPEIELDFSGMPQERFPINLGRCVAIRSVSGFAPDRFEAARASSRAPSLGGARPADAPEAARRAGPRAGADLMGALSAPGRTSNRSGPLLRYGGYHGGEAAAFLQSDCSNEDRDGAKLSGFRLFGPSFGSQKTDEKGYRVLSCVGVEISNMEIAGWGGAGVEARDGTLDDIGTDFEGRLKSPGDVVISRSYIHHNQHPSENGHAAGYGVVAAAGAWARIVETVFDENRHAIAANGKAGGYDAQRNLILKGGGYHGRTFAKYTHQFDAHGDDSCVPAYPDETWPFDDLRLYNCGKAGIQFWIIDNVFQYRRGNAVKLRGKPRIRADIIGNVFPHPGLEDDWGDDAIALATTENVNIGAGNIINSDSFGKYAVCDFDGDRIDDLFLATGRTWWFSSMGEFAWTYLARRNDMIEALRFAYVDGDDRCDVIGVRGDQLMMSSGGTGDWISLGEAGASIDNLAIGQFDDRIRDHRANVVRRATGVFRREQSGQWSVRLFAGGSWVRVQNSSLPMKKLRFGDFDGDGVTDVLAVIGGKWSVSDGARGSWRPLNPHHGDDVGKLLIANLDPDDNIDDLVRADVSVANSVSGAVVEIKVKRSKNGTEKWEEIKKHRFQMTAIEAASFRTGAFAGAFGAGPGGAVVIIQPDRHGAFYGPYESPADWRSSAAY